MLNNRKNIYITLAAATIIVLFLFSHSRDIKAPTTGIIKSTEHAADSTQSPEVLTVAPLLFPELDYRVFYDIELSNDYLDVLYQKAQVLDIAITSGNYTAAASAAMSVESGRIHDLILDIKSDIANYITWEQEYYYAAKTYEFLRQNGYSAEVTCAIIGNMMAECGGLTLNLNPNAYNSYEHGGGLCGWLYRYYPEANGASFEEQCKLLLNTIKGQFDKYGFCYYKGFSYEAFLAMTSVEDAALAFAKVYERCASFSYNVRKTAAITAYKYFVGE